MRFSRFVLCAQLVVLAGCHFTPPHRPMFSEGFPIYDCPASLEGRVRLATDVRPIAVPKTVLMDNAGSGAIGRRVTVTVLPAGLQPSDSIVWSSLALNSLGGTFASWARVQTEHEFVEGPGEKQPEKDCAGGRAGKTAELLGVSSAPGQVRITRSARDETNLMGDLSLDVFVVPGGVAVDETVLRIASLWRQDGSPVRQDQVKVELTPIRRPPGYDVVHVDVQLDYIVRRGRSNDEWSCSAETRLTVVDRDALRQPFWDLGLASSNQGRKEWLALFDPALGAVRAVFTSPASANALASWIQATGANAIGSYALGVFAQPPPSIGRPFSPVDPDAMRTFRPLQAADLPALRVGPVGEE